ncbi:MAG: HD domain-containing protein [Candidatus Paceibacterota bacterium]
MKTSRYNIPQSVQNILDSLESSGFEAFLVGGCVRDLFLNKTPKDWDVTTNATPEEIQEIFPDSFYENTFGTVGVKTEDEDPTLKVIEITPYRLESEYSDHRHPDKVSFSKNIKDDLSRRDFTINAIALSKGQIVDLYKGQDDLEAKVIRTVGDPKERFREDALRIMRAVRFSAELGFIIESETANAISELGGLLEKVSRERIRDEFKKLIMSDNPMIGIVMLQKLGILKYVSTAIDGMVGVSQETQAHKYDVFEHSLRALQHSADKGHRLELRLAVLFHDIAKPHTKRMVGNKATFYGHEVVGAKVTRETLADLRFSRETIEEVTRLVRWHMFFADPDQITLSAVRRIITKVGTDSIWDLVELRKCDRIGTGRPVEEPYRFRKYQSMIEEALRAPLSVGMLKVDGVKLMELGVEKGPRIGAILHALLEEVLDEPEKNTDEHLVTRVTDLNKMSDAQLDELGKKGKDRLEEEDDKVIQELKAKHKVK